MNRAEQVFKRFRIPVRHICILVVSWFCAATTWGDPLENWTRRSPLSLSDKLNRLIFADNTFFAVGSGGVILTSSNGISWTERNVGEPVDLQSLAYVNGLFVAVGWSETGFSVYRGRIFTSSDGVSWTSQESGSTNVLSDIAYGNGTFVVVGYGRKTPYDAFNLSEILTSPDGINWTRRTAVADRPLFGVAFGHNLFVAVGGSGTIVTSQDGVTWQNRYSGTGKDFVTVTFADEQFVAGGATFVLASSTDGIRWSQQPAGIAVWIGGITYGKGIFLGVGAAASNQAITGGAIVTFANGQWTSQAAMGSQMLMSVAFGNDTFVVVGDAGTFWTSSDGIAWTQRSNGTQTYFQDVTYGNETFVAVGGVQDRGRNTQGPAILSSTDGYSWQQRLSGVKSGLSSVAFGNGLFIIPSGGGNILSSSDGVVWTNRTSVAEVAFTRVAFVNNLFFGLGLPGSIWTSPDGLTWSKQSTGTPAVTQAAAWGNGRFVVIAGADTVLTSSDAITWTEQPGIHATQSELKSISFGSGMFIVVAVKFVFPRFFNGVIFSSTDGVAWTQRYEIAGGLYDGIYAAGNFVAVGTPSASIPSSIDGLNWTTHTNVPPCVAITYGKGSFVIVDLNGGIYQSDPLLRFRPVEKAFSDGTLKLTLDAQSGARLLVETSANLETWKAFGTLTNSTGSVEIRDVLPQENDSRFYRARVISP